MGKKNRVPESGQSAFESAKAAFDRVGEDYVPASKAVELSKTEEPVETPDAAAPETPVDTVPVSDTDAAAPDTSEAVATPDANGVEAADSASDADDVTTPDTDADTSEAVDSDATPEAVEAPDTSGSVDSDATPEPPVAETVEAPDTPEAVDSDTTPGTVDSAGTPDDATADETPDTDSAEPEPETDHDSATPEPEAVEVAGDEAEEADDFWTFDVDEPEAEVTEMEKMTMETKEITLGVHRSPPKEADGAETVKETKKPRFKAFAQWKDLFRIPAENTEQSEQSGDTPQSGGSSRDAAIRKRVMQIEDEETRNYLLDRVLPQMTWYSKKSAQYQAMYYRLMAATIFMGALIPAFSVGANNTAVKVILALLGASVTGINAYLALHNYHDLWITYRTTREDLIHHLYCYFNKAGVFSSSEDLNVLLVNICEDTLSKENGGWTTIIQKTPTIS